MSRAQYDSLMENLHIRHSKPNYEWLKESIKQAEEGKLVNFDVEDSHMNVSFTENAWADHPCASDKQKRRLRSIPKNPAKLVL